MFIRSTALALNPGSKSATEEGTEPVHRHFMFLRRRSQADQVRSLQASRQVRLQEKSHLQ